MQKRKLGEGLEVSALSLGAMGYGKAHAQAGIDEFMLSSKWFYRDRPFPAWQMVWPDQAGTFPWQAGFDESLAHVQPDLTVSGWTHAVQATSGRAH